MATSRLLYAVVARGSVVLAEHRSVPCAGFSIISLPPSFMLSPFPLCSVASGNAHLLAVRILEKLDALEDV